MIKDITLGAFPGIVYEPENVDTVKIAYLFYPGNGEISNGNTKVLEKNNLFPRLRAGYTPDFVFAAVQPGKAWPTITEIAGNIEALKNAYPGAKIVLTGVSLGAYTVANFALLNPNRTLIDGLILMSIAPAVTDRAIASLNGVPVLAFVGTADKTAYWSHRAAIATLRDAGADISDNIDSGGHGPWEPKYAPDFSVPGTEGNVYDYMLTKLTEDAPSGDPVKTLISTTVVTVKAYSDGTTEIL